MRSLRIVAVNNVIIIERADMVMQQCVLFIVAVRILLPAT
jgi:hypothetical protein